MKKRYLTLIFLFLLVNFSFGQNLKFEQTLNQSSRIHIAYNPIEDFFFWLASEITYGILIESSFERDTPMHDAQLSPYPYFTPKDGNYNYEGKYTLVRLEMQSNLLLDKNQKFTGNISGKLRFLQRFDVAVSHTQLNQQDLTNSYFLTQTAVMLNYHRIRTRQFDFWYGLGVMFTESRYNSSGLQWELGAELFLQKQFSVNTEIYRSYFDTTTLQKTNVTLNYFISRWRLQGGIQNFNFLNQQINTVNLGLKYYF